MALNAGEWQKAIIADCQSFTVLNFMLDTVPFGLRAGLNNVWSLKNAKSYKFGSHLIIVFTRLSLKKKTNFFFVQTKSEDGVNSLFQEAISVILKILPTRKIGFQTFSREIFFKWNFNILLEPLEQFFRWVLPTR